MFVSGYLNHLLDRTWMFFEISVGFLWRCRQHFTEYLWKSYVFLMGFEVAGWSWKCFKMIKIVSNIFVVFFLEWGDFQRGIQNIECDFATENLVSYPLSNIMPNSSGPEPVYRGQSIFTPLIFQNPLPVAHFLLTHLSNIGSWFLHLWFPKFSRLPRFHL